MITAPKIFIRDQARVFEWVLDHFAAMRAHLVGFVNLCNCKAKSIYTYTHIVWLEVYINVCGCEGVCGVWL